MYLITITQIKIIVSTVASTLLVLILLTLKNFLDLFPLVLLLWSIIRFMRFFSIVFKCDKCFLINIVKFPYLTMFHLIVKITLQVSKSYALSCKSYANHFYVIKI